MHSMRALYMVHNETRNKVCYQDILKDQSDEHNHVDEDRQTNLRLTVCRSIDARWKHTFSILIPISQALGARIFYSIDKISLDWCGSHTKPPQAICVDDSAKEFLGAGVSQSQYRTINMSKSLLEALLSPLCRYDWEKETPRLRHSDNSSAGAPRIEFSRSAQHGS